MRTGRIITVLLAALTSVACLAGIVGCAASPAGNDADAAPLKVAAMKGPTAIGLASLMQEQDALADEGKKPAYEFTVAATADELVPRVAAGDFDIACVPANLAVKLYEQTGGAIRVIGINTLGVLYGVSHDGDVHDIADLAGRTVYLTG